MGIVSADRRWPWQRREARDAGGGYTDAVVAAIEAQTAQKVADASSTAAIEAVAGMLSRAFGDAVVDADDWARQAVTLFWLTQVGRSLVGRDRLVYVRWGTSPGTRYRGQGPTSWASLTARLQGGAERSLGDEAAGPLAQILPIPQSPGDGEDDPLAGLRADIGAARGKAVLVETTAAGWGEGRGSAPQADWKPSRLGPMMPEAMVRVADSAFARMVAACGASVSLFTDADGTAQREVLRRWHMGTVRPLARLLEHELTTRLETTVRLRFDGYPKDLQARASTFKALVAGGVAVNEALATAGLLEADE